MDCATHGATPPVMACKHVRNAGRLRLFIVPADDEWPTQAWCGRCERARIKDKGWYDYADGVADWAFICSACFDEVRERAKTVVEYGAEVTPEEKPADQ